MGSWDRLDPGLGVGLGLRLWLGFLRAGAYTEVSLLSDHVLSLGAAVSSFAVNVKSAY